MKLDIQKLKQYEEDGLITCAKHPKFELYIYNYSQKTQFSKAWDDITLKCRGLVTDAEGMVIARSFDKFFNMGEIADQKIPEGPFEVQEKMDGSMFMLFKYNDEWIGCTRGSFISEQAVKGMEIFEKKYKDVIEELHSKEHEAEYFDEKQRVYVFEVLYPENRIVVDYGNKEDIVLLTVFGEGYDGEWVEYRVSDKKVNLPMPQKFSINPFKDKLEEKKNEEGYVLKWPNGFRLKVKFDEYKRLHRILTNCTARTIWDVLRTNGSLDDFIKNVPDEFYKFVDDTVKGLKKEYRDIECECLYKYSKMLDELTRKQLFLGTKESRKEFSKLASTKTEFYTKNSIAPILFKMYDEKDYSDLIWKMIKPSATKPFKVEI